MTARAALLFALLLGAGCDDGPIKTCKRGEPKECEEKCNKKHAASCNNLGMHYLEGIGTEKDKAKAAPAFEKACNLGHLGACEPAALLYSGEAEGIENDDKAFKLASKGCDGGEAKHPGSCATLATLYFNGEGTERDYKKAGELADRFCGMSVATACYVMALLHKDGLGDYAKDETKMKSFATKACERDHKAACKLIDK